MTIMMILLNFNFDFLPKYRWVWEASSNTRKCLSSNFYDTDKLVKKKLGCASYFQPACQYLEIKGRTLTRIWTITSQTFCQYTYDVIHYHKISVSLLDTKKFPCSVIGSLYGRLLLTYIFIEGDACTVPKYRSDVLYKHGPIRQACEKQSSHISQLTVKSEQARSIGRFHVTSSWY